MITIFENGKLRKATPDEIKIVKGCKSVDKDGNKEGLDLLTQEERINMVKEKLPSMIEKGKIDTFHLTQIFKLLGYKLTFKLPEVLKGLKCPHCNKRSSIEIDNIMDPSEEYSICIHKNRFHYIQSQNEPIDYDYAYELGSLYCYNCDKPINSSHLEDNLFESLEEFANDNLKFDIEIEKL